MLLKIGRLVDIFKVTLLVMASGSRIFNVMVVGWRLYWFALVAVIVA